MDEAIGCGDSSCTFRIIRPSGGMATNGGCRCFKNLEHWNERVGKWNHDEVRKVQRDTQRVVNELRRVRDQLEVSQAKVAELESTIEVNQTFYRLVVKERDAAWTMEGLLKMRIEELEEKLKEKQ